MVKFNNFAFRWSFSMPTSVALTPYLENFTKQLVSSGRYNNVSEVVRESLRLMEKQQLQDTAKLNALRDAIQVADDDVTAGRVVSFNSAKEFGQRLKSMRSKATSPKV
jgi:antitoxin ParD1/3/4